jgi:hypothetical protein
VKNAGARSVGDRLIRKPHDVQVAAEYLRACSEDA